MPGDDLLVGQHLDAANAAADFDRLAQVRERDRVLPALEGDQVNTITGARDAFVTRIDAGLTTASTTYIGTSEDDQADSVTWLRASASPNSRFTIACASSKLPSIAML